MNRKVLVNAIMAAASILKEPMPSDRLAGYVAVLGEYPVDAIIDALGRIVRRDKWFPKPAQIITEYKEIARRPPRFPPMLSGPEPTADQRNETDRIIEQSFATHGWKRCEDGKFRKGKTNGPETQD